MTPEVSRALDVVASDATIPNPEGDVITITCDNDQITEEIQHLFNETLDMNSNSFQ